MKIPKMQKQIEKVCFDCEIIEFKLVALNTRIYCERLLVIGCQHVNKQGQDFRYFLKIVFGTDSLSE